MIPLADRMRPRNLEEFIGQEHIIAPDKLLYKAIKQKLLFSMIFWGPPGVGKTTLARIIAIETGSEFMEFSAVNTSTVELKRIFGEIREKRKSFDFAQDENNHRVIIFIDEIHRFSKSQQDAFLPFVENGTITLIGATTENPSFEIISPLLSRSRVFVLKPLSKEQLKKVVEQALKDPERGLGKHKINIDSEAVDLLLEASFGDARVALTTLEVAVSAMSLHSKPSNGSSLHKQAELCSSLRGDEGDEAIFHKIGRSPRLRQAQPRDDKLLLTREMIEEAFQRKMLNYDKAGEEHFNTISAFIKSMRASNPDAALYYLARMVEAGEDPLFIARRMVIFASEDIGVIQPTALVVANAVFRACETIGFPECQENLAHGVVYLSLAKKDRSAYDAYFKALEDVKTYGNLPIPMNLRNAPTKLMKDLGYGEGYQKYTDQDLLPEKLKGKKYYTE